MRRYDTFKRMRWHYQVVACFTEMKINLAEQKRIWNEWPFIKKANNLRQPNWQTFAFQRNTILELYIEIMMVENGSPLKSFASLNS